MSCKDCFNDCKYCNENPINYNDNDFIEWAKDKFTDEQWERICDLISNI